MTNREWLETLSDEKLAKVVVKKCNMCSLSAVNNYICKWVDSFKTDDCVFSIKNWLSTQHEQPKREFALGELTEHFQDKFKDRRAISLDEVEKVIRGLFE